MHIKIDKKELEKAVRVAKMATDKRSSMPVLEALKISASDGNAIISATDLSRWFTAEVQAEVIVKGEVLIKPQMLVKLLKAAKCETVEIIKTADNRLKIGNISVGLENVDDYPEFPAFKVNKKMIVKTADLNQALTDTVFAASVDDTRINLCAVRCEFSKGKMRAVATSGRRLATRTVDSRFKGKDISFSLPTAAVKLFLGAVKIVDETNLTTAISYARPEQEHGPAKIRIELPGMIIQTRSDGNYPDWRQTFKESADEQKLATFNIDELQKALSEILSICANNYHLTIIRWSDGGCCLSHENVINNIKAEIQLKCEHGEEIEDVGFNPHFMMELLKHAPASDTITFQIDSALSPMIVRHNETDLDLIMPMMI